ncbi:hypothetical protein Agub_g6288 [Astrephomene gubernaculifera]|uniref:Uncharacterized protein n=1 Tax=Astrephomene gubernaculifera TaxID=47775 RepID=A0AAD3DQQ9_9CHLO|nr:hypothetical protein Agub_g6288 [Astrephomene gubernaculifera]
MKAPPPSSTQPPPSSPSPAPPPPQQPHASSQLHHRQPHHQQQQQQERQGCGMGAPPPQPQPPGSYYPAKGPYAAPPQPQYSPLPAALLADAASSQALLPSRTALAALLAVPLALWGCAVGAGVAAAEPLKEGAARRDFEHPLIGFDRYVFRVWGPLLPLAPYLVRIAAAAAGNAAARLFTPTSSSMRVVRGMRPAAVQQPRPGVTLPLLSLAVYGAIIAVRVLLYLGHLSFQRAVARVVVSDHLFLGASVVACFQAELLMCLSDIYKAELLRGSDPWVGARQLTVVAAMVTSMFVLVFVYGDMYCTARWYHEPAESLGALAVGAAVFQLPVVVWMWLHGRRGLPRGGGKP